MTVVRRRLTLATALAATVVGFASLAFAQSIPDRELNRDGLRRALLDTCVYTEAAKDGAKKEKVADACQCASVKAMKNIKQEDVAKISSDRAIPDDLYRAATEAYGTCTR